MKAEIKLDIQKEDLQYELSELVREISESEIKKMIKKQANEMVKNEIEKILHPLVLSVLTDEKFEFDTGYRDYTHSKSLDEKLKQMVVNYLNRPSYLYSKSKRIPSERYMPSSSNNESSLINHIVSDEIRLFVDTEFTPVVKNMIIEIVSDKEKIENVLKEQIKQMVLEKIK